MRETNINKAIDRTEVKVGDKITVSRVVTVNAVRESSVYNGVGKDRRPVTIIDTETDTLALAEKENITLLERDKPSEIRIPLTATHVFWQDTEGYDYYARRDSVSQEWTTTVDPTLKFTTEALIKEIENDLGEFDKYKEGTFEVLKNKYATGGFTGIQLGEGSLNKLREQLSRNVIVPSNLNGIQNGRFGA